MVRYKFKIYNTGYTILVSFKFVYVFDILEVQTK